MNKMVIMAGGFGERFWPVSSKKNPKQLVNFFGEKSLLEQTVARCIKLADEENIYISTNVNLENQIKNTNLLPYKQYFVEDISKNTLGSFIWSLAHIIAAGNDYDTVCFLPADHLIENEENFLKDLKTGFKLSNKENKIVIFGVKPTRAETGYGYIQAQESDVDFLNILNFIEKPKQEDADLYFYSENYYWNAGVFIFPINLFIEQLKEHQLETYIIFQKIINLLKSNQNEEARKIFWKLKSISIDYALMEKTKEIIMIPLSCGWDDLGSWTSLERIYTPDIKGNTILGGVKMCSLSNSIIVNKQNFDLKVLGLDNIIVVVHNNKILICDKNACNLIKDIK